MRGKRQKIFPRKITIIKKEGGKWVIDIDMKDKKSTTLNGVYETISELIGFDNAVKIYESFRGSQVNFPTRLFSKEFVLQEAIKAYDGTSELKDKEKLESLKAEAKALVVKINNIAK